MTRQPRTTWQYLQLLATAVVLVIALATVARVLWLVWSPLF
jgi:hypothetical protein